MINEYPLPFLPERYRTYIKTIGSAHSTPLWIIGGWPFSSHIQSPYFGDLDLVSGQSHEELDRLFSRKCLTYSKNSSGNFRILLADDNYVDISPFDSFGPNVRGITDVLSTFPFSCVAIGMEVRSGQLTYGPGALRDVERRWFHFNTQATINQNRVRAALRDYYKFKHFYGLEPKNELAFLRFFGGLARSYDAVNSMTLPMRFKSIKQTLQPYLPPRRAWLSRGIIRVLRLANYTAFDDIDVIVEMDVDECWAFFSGADFPVVSNFFNCPKLILGDGIKVDIIPKPREISIDSFVANFALSLDQFCWALDEEQLLDLRGPATDDTGLSLSFSPSAARAHARDRAYYAIKSVYFALRHDLTLAGDLVNAVQAPEVFVPHLHKRAFQLSVELAVLIRRETLFDRISRLGAPINGSALHLFATFLSHHLSARWGKMGEGELYG
jgi:hypothetical protein